MKALKKELDEQLLVEAAKRDPSRFAKLYRKRHSNRILVSREVV